MLSIDTYDEYGIPGSSNAGLFQYTGQVYLAQVGMYYYRNRFFSMTLGRFMSADPIGPADNANLYAYVDNDPVNRTDPLGLQSTGCPGDTVGETCKPIVVTAPAPIVITGQRPPIEGSQVPGASGCGGNCTPIVITAKRTPKSKKQQQQQQACTALKFDIASLIFDTGGAAATVLYPQARLLKIGIDGAALASAGAAGDLGGIMGGIADLTHRKYF